MQLVIFHLIEPVIAGCPMIHSRFHFIRLHDIFHRRHLFMEIAYIYRLIINDLKNAPQLIGRNFDGR